MGDGGEKPGLVLLEHINLVVQDDAASVAFYGDELRCRRDERRSPQQALHMNCGSLTQFHLPLVSAAYPSPQVWRGHAEIAFVPPAPRREVRCPYGNRFITREAWPTD